MYNNYIEDFGQGKKLREKGQFEPDKKTTVIIADYFNVTIDYLFERKD